MRKLFSIIVLAAFILSLASPAFAAEPQTKVSKEEALNVAREKLEVPDNMTLNMISYRFEQNGNEVWSFSWNSDDPKKPSDMSAEIDAVTGRLRSFGRYSPDNYTGKNNLTLEEAQALASEFVKKMNPDEFDQLKLEPQTIPDIGIMEKKIAAVPFRAPDYYFKFNRIVNGYPYWGNGVNLNISGSSGKIVNYYFNWDNSELPSVDSIVYREQAWDKINGVGGLELAYLRINDEANPSGKSVLGYYYPSYFGPLFVDAVSGDVVDYSGNIIKPRPEASPPLADTAAAQPDTKSLTEDEAMSLAEKWVNVPADYCLSGAYYNESPKGITPTTWNFSWNSKKRAGYISCGINADTGEVTNMEASYAPYATPQSQITEDEAAQIAADFLKKVAPSKANQLRLETQGYNPEYGYVGISEDKRPYYNFRFSRLVNGLPVVDGGANIGVNGEGKVTSYWMMWENFDFPAADDVIGLEKAAAVMSDQAGMELGYASTQDGNGGWKTMLVYRSMIDSGMYVDAVTGEIKNRWGGPIYYTKSKFSDVGGHWAEKDIQKLADLQILPADQKDFRPDDTITRADFAVLAAKALGLASYTPEKPTFSDVSKEDKDYGYIEAAFKAGIIAGDKGKFDPRGSMTREAMAVILLNGFKGLSQDDKATLEQFKDSDKVSAWAKDSVLSAVKAGLFKGDAKGYLNPLGKVTRAEAAALLSRALEAKPVLDTPVAVPETAVKK